MWFESGAVEAARNLVPPSLAFPVALLSLLGSVYIVVPVVVSSYWFGDRYRGITWIGYILGGYSIMNISKGWVGAARPDVAPPVAVDSFPIVLRQIYASTIEIPTASFPSGHVMMAIMFWGLLAVELDIDMSAPARWTAVATIVVLVAFSRVALGVHFVGDVVGGALIGLAYLGGATLLFRRVGQQPRVTLGVAVALGVVGIPFVGFHLNALSILTASSGALLAWELATPPRQPWPRNRTGGKYALTGILCMLGAAAVVPVLGPEHPILLVVAGVVLATVVGMPELTRLYESQSG